jgi:prepilin-type N-terminal cleavage/methylation domain-containing protein
MLQKKQKGFTLVEIAIVLVIVGLLIGGVLKGQEMITNAKLKRIESDNAGLAAAVFSYQDRYLQLPGDDTDASTRFDNFTAFGDGDGSIEGNWWVDPEAGGSDETGKFWMMLRASGLVSGDPKDFQGQQNAYAGRIGVSSGALGIGGHVIVFGQLEGSVVKIVESRLDDGDPGKGRVRSRSASTDAFAAVDNSGAEPTGGATDAADPPYSDLALYDTVFRF